MDWLLPLPVAAPLLGAALVAVTDHVTPRRVKNVIAIGSAAVALATSLAILVQSEQGLVVHWFGGWHPDGKVAIGIGFVADPYGAGLASSFGESAYALDSGKPERLAFDFERVLRTPYRSDTFQPRYFVVDGLDTLRTGIDLTGLEARLEGL